MKAPRLMQAQNKIYVRRLVAAVAFVLLAALLLGCWRKASAPAPNDSAVLTYGYGPRPDLRVSYQPDVVLIGDGPHAIHSVSDDGLTWTIDGNANGADRLSVGKIMFATSRAVGRVRLLERRGKDLAVTLGPVELTEVIRDADLSINMHMNPDAMLFYQSVPPESTANLFDPNLGAQLRPAAFRVPRRRARLIPAGLTGKFVGKVKVGHWEIEPYFKRKDSDTTPGSLPTNAGKVPQPERSNAKERPETQEIGLKVQYNVISENKEYEQEHGVKQKYSTGLKFGGSVRFWGQDIRLRSHIPISGGKANGPSTIVIDGIEKVHIGLVGGVDNGDKDNVSNRVEIPAEFSEHIPPEVTNGIPLAIHVKFKFLVETAFSGANSTLWTHGLYKLSGPIGYENGVLRQPSLEVEEPMMNDLHGIAVGVSGVVLAVEVRLLVGLGTEVFMGGPYFKLIMAAGVTKGSVLAFGLGGLKGGPTCRSVTIKGDIGFGFGLVVGDKWFKNDILQKIVPKKTELELAETSGTFFNKGWFAPDIPLCNPKATTPFDPKGSGP